jgi:hypothetical protein
MHEEETWMGVMMHLCFCGKWGCILDLRAAAPGTAGVAFEYSGRVSLSEILLKSAYELYQAQIFGWISSVMKYDGIICRTRDGFGQNIPERCDMGSKPLSGPNQRRLFVAPEFAQHELCLGPIPERFEACYIFQSMALKKR